eukprot:c23113_g3_i6 orf=2-307(-)
MNIILARNAQVMTRISLGKLQRPVKILANFLQDRSAHLWKLYLSKLVLRKISRGGEHTFESVGDDGGLAVDDKLEALGAYKLDCVLCAHGNGDEGTRERERE